MTDCSHPIVICLNQHEFVRKYRCQSCSGVMLCACDEEFAVRFLPHQLRDARDNETRLRVPVTLGFQANICNACRGMPEESHPMAPQHGRTSKIHRYYWREIWFETTRRFADWLVANGGSDRDVILSHDNVERKRIEKEVIKEIKELHQRQPKYTFADRSQQDVILTNQVEVIVLGGTYVKQAEGRALLLHEGQTLSVESFASLHFQKLGFEVLVTESIPFHVLFGVYLWLVIQDPDDSLAQMRSFGERGDGDALTTGRLIWTPLPEDFGSPAYQRRRAAEIDEHFASMLGGDRDDLLWTFDYWLEPSNNLRQYLWAHRPQHIAQARQIVAILPPDVIRRILRYLTANYWKRFCGCPTCCVIRPTNSFSLR